MERQPIDESKIALQDCLVRLNGELELGVAYHQFGDTEQRFMHPAAKEYIRDRAQRIAAGESVWMAREMTSETGRTFDYFDGGRAAGSLSIDLETNQVLAQSLAHGEETYPYDDLVEAVNFVDGALVAA